MNDAVAEALIASIRVLADSVSELKRRIERLERELKIDPNAMVAYSNAS